MKKPPHMWRIYKCDDGVWQCHPSHIAGWPEDVSTLCGKAPAPLLDKAWTAMEKVAAPYIADELRALADMFEHAPDLYTAGELRARANELDPSGATPRRGAP